MKRIGENAGFVKVYRDLAKTDLWLAERFTKGQALVDVMLLTQGVNNVQWEGGKLKNFRAGTAYVSKEQLAERWGWNRKTVASFLKQLSNEGIVSVVSRGLAGTQITIENWDYYQKNPKNNEETDSFSPVHGHMITDTEDEETEALIHNGFSDSSPDPQPCPMDNSEGSFSGHNKEKIKNYKEKEKDIYCVRFDGFSESDPRSASAPLDGGGSAGKERIPAEYRDKFDSYEAYYRWRNQ